MNNHPTPEQAPTPVWPRLAAARPAWIAYQYGDRDRQVVAQAAVYQAYLDAHLLALRTGTGTA